MSGILSYAGWYFLPRLVTGYIQTALYAIFIRAGDPKPTPGSPRFVQDQRRIQICVILIYLVYSIYEADHDLQLKGDFYSLLGVPLDTDEKAIQSRFRRLTVQYHPDKATGADRQAIEAIYVHLKLARDTLVDPAKRFAYDRFGVEVLAWQHCKKVRDYVFTGLQNITVYYVGTFGGLLLLSFFGYLQSGKFWRYLVMASLYLLEVHVMALPEFPAILMRLINPFLVTTGLRNPYLPFQMLKLLRSVAIAFFIAFSQLGPLIRGPRPIAADSDTIPPQLVNQLDAFTKMTDQEISRLYGLELAPFANEDPTMKPLRASLKEWLVQNTIRNDAEVKAAVNRVLERRRQEANSITDR